MSNKFSNGSGFTLIEIMIVMALVLSLMGYATVNLNSSQYKASLSNTTTTFVTDLRSQQEKAMIGDTEGRASADSYGVYFGTNSYTLFHGSSYNSADTSNFVIQLGDQVQFTNVTFPSSQVVFQRVNGEVSGFTNGSNTLTLKNMRSNEQKTVTINRYGVVTAVN